MKRLFWMGVGVGVTVAAVRYGRKLYAQYVPADAAAAFDTAAKVGRTARGVLGELAAGIAEREEELRTALLGEGTDPDEVRAKGFHVTPGDLGENITTRGIDLLGLSAGTRLHLGDEAVIEITGVRNPCHQIDDFQKGLLHATLDTSGPTLVRKSGVMSIVLTGGDVRPGDTIRVAPPDGPLRPLMPI